MLRVTVPIPNELLRLAENHVCFSGCYSPGHDSLCLVKKGAPPEVAFDVQCEDCLSFRLGGLASQLGSGMNRYRLAKELSAHMCAQRGYAFAFGGYHTQGGGFWLSAAYFAHIGVFVLKSDRGVSAAGSSDSDLLVKAFTTGVVKPPVTGMLDPGKYASHRVFLNVVGLPVVSSAQALLSSQHVSTTPSPGYVEVTLAEYVPIARASSAASSGLPRSSRPVAPSVNRGVAAASAQRRRPARLGEICDVCGQAAVERALLTSTYVACGCD